MNYIEYLKFKCEVVYEYIRTLIPLFVLAILIMIPVAVAQYYAGVHVNETTITEAK